MRTARKAMAAVVTAAAAFAAVGAAPSALAAPATRPVAHRASAVAFRPGSGQLVVDWNRELITILGTAGAQPATVHPTRSFAILQAAEYDAVTSITRAAPSYRFTVPAPRGAPPDAAAEKAAHDVLTALATTTPPPARSLNPNLPYALSDLIARLMSKDLQLGLAAAAEAGHDLVVAPPVAELFAELAAGAEDVDTSAVIRLLPGA